MFRLICTTLSILATVWSIWPNTFCAQHHVKKLYIGEMIFRFKGKYIKSVADTTNKYMRTAKSNLNFVVTTYLLAMERGEERRDPPNAGQGMHHSEGYIRGPEFSVDGDYTRDPPDAGQGMHHSEGYIGRPEFSVDGNYTRDPPNAGHQAKAIFEVPNFPFRLLIIGRITRATHILSIILNFR